MYQATSWVFFSEHETFLLSVSSAESFPYRNWCICVSESWQWWRLLYLLRFLWSSWTGIVYCNMISAHFLFISLMVSEQVSQCCVILQLNLTGHKHGLADEETKDLWVQADIDGNGVVDYKEFQVDSMKLSLYSSQLCVLSERSSSTCR